LEEQTVKSSLTALAVIVPTVFSFYSLQRPAAPAATPVAYVSTQRIVAEVSDAKAALGRAQAKQQEKAGEFRTRQQAYEATRQQLSTVTDGAKRAELMQKEQQQRAELERDVAAMQSELMASQRQLQTELQGLLTPVLEALAKERQVQVVLNSDVSVVWAGPGLDLTGDVIQRLNAKK
jgi:Skp family chaperone for outer membrane proteins